MKDHFGHLFASGECFEVTCQLCKVSLGSPTELRRHCQSHLRKKKGNLNFEDWEKYERLIPPEIYRKRNPLVEMSNPSREPIISCPLCSNVFPTILTFAEHVTEKHLDLQNQPDDNVTDDQLEQEEEDEIVDRLKVMEKKWLEVRKNIRYRHAGVNKNAFCKICQKKFWSSKYLLTIHNPSVHPDRDYSVTCEICGKVFKTRHRLSHHRSHSHRDAVKKKTWNKVVRQRFLVKKSLENEDSEKSEDAEEHPKVKKKSTYKLKYQKCDDKLLCSQCNFSTHYKHLLKNHIKFKHENQPRKEYTCAYCDYKSVFKTNWQRHQFSQHEYKLGINTDKALVCQYCSFVTPDRNIYLDHVRHVHEGVPRKKRSPRKRKKVEK